MLGTYLLNKWINKWMNDCPIGPLVAPLSLYTILPSIFPTGSWYNYSIYNMVRSEEKLFLTLGKWLWSSGRSVRNSKFLLPATRILGGLWAPFIPYSLCLFQSKLEVFLIRFSQETSELLQILWGFTPLDKSHTPTGLFEIILSLPWFSFEVAERNCP